jgi:hypothetical protein
MIMAQLHKLEEQGITVLDSDDSEDEGGDG